MNQPGEPKENRNISNNHSLTLIPVRLLPEPLYEALDIRKERIDPGQPWQNYIEAHFGIMWNYRSSILEKS